MEPQLISLKSKISPDISVKLKESLSVVKTIQEDLLIKIREDYSKALKEYLRKNLNNKGFVFLTEGDFDEFLKKRVRRVKFRDEEEVHYYLDWKSDQERGTMIGLTHENRVRIEYKDGKVTGVIG